MTTHIKKRCRIGVIGAGRIGKLHAENIAYRLPQFKLMGIADPYLDIDWAKSLHVPIITQESHELLHHSDIDAVIIASPSNMHIQQVLTASKLKKAIFCEKPLGLTEEDIENCLSQIKQDKTLLQIGFNRRFDPNFANIAMRVRAGEIGMPQLLRITSRDPACPSKEYARNSGGIFMDMTIHDFDMARFLMNSEITEVYAAGAVLINPDFKEFNDIDTATVQLRFENGALGVIDNSRQAVYGYDQRVEVFGAQGMLIAENQKQNNVLQYHREGTQASNPEYFFLERYQTAYIMELEAFYEAWLNHKESSVNGYDGLQALRIANAANASLRTNKAIKVGEKVAI